MKTKKREAEKWNIEVDVDNEDGLMIVVALDAPGGIAFHTLPLTEEEAHELAARLRQAFDQIKQERGRRSLRPLPAAEPARKLNGKARAVSSVATGDRECAQCLGSGKIADDVDGAPWPCWEGLPEESKLAVTLGLVKPVPCPACVRGGKGGGK